MISKILTLKIKSALAEVGAGDAPFSVEYPDDFSHGDYATNAALLAAKKLGQNPQEVAKKITDLLLKEEIKEIEKIEIAGPGFINFFLSRDFFAKNIKDALSIPDFGKGHAFEGKKVIVEYTDPNPFKEFHIGHLMTNIIGESISRLYEWQGAEVKRANYQGDVGLHVAYAVWGLSKMKLDMPAEDTSLKTKAAFLGKAYVKGAHAYKEEEEAQKEIREINKKIFDKSDKDVTALYEKGRKWSLDYFETIYARLGTKFDFYFFESGVADHGVRLVRNAIGGSLFEESEGAIVFRGEKVGLHTRVFINKDGLPTYEAKELALALAKNDAFPYDLSFVVTGSEIKEYFKVLLKALESIDRELAKKTIHVPHGMLRLPSGKMSSRTGDVITAETLIGDVTDTVRSRMKNEAIEKEEKEKIIEDIALGAIKFAVLRQAIGRDIIFNLDSLLSFEGDSGPYLQYTVVRARAVLEKARETKKKESIEKPSVSASVLERLLIRFPEIIERATREHAPHLLMIYLLELSGAFNTFYGQGKIVDDSEESSYKIALTKGVEHVLTNGLALLGLRVPSEM